ncbi:MAG: ABC transporter ATP-binding protein [Thermoanaerobaculia bacterium]
MADEPLLALRDVHKSYGSGEVVEEVLHGIDIAVNRGEFVALIGPSGSGKSTLLNVIGLLDRPTAGVVMLAGRDTTAFDERERTNFRGRTLGFVFQFHYLLPAFTAEENVMMPLLAVRGREEAWMRERAGFLLERVGLAQKRGSRTNKLSGGQQQRVAIARALAGKPALVLADEPTGNLDTETGNQVFGLLREFAEEEKTTFLVVTHDTRIASRCDRVIELVDGRVVG